MMRSPLQKTTLLCLFGALLFTSTAEAAPLINPGQAPGLVKTWTSAGGATTLTVAEATSAEAVAEAILAKVPGTQAKAEGHTVVVTGIDEAQLLVALEGIDLGGEDDDVDAMLSALQNPGGDEDGSGSSIRAGKKAELDDVAGPPGPLVYGSVTAVRHARYPLVILTVKVRRGPKGGHPAQGQTIQVVPYVSSKDGAVDPDDAQSQLNVGAWYVQKGDRVRLRLETKARKKVWVAKAFERAK